MTTIRFSLAVVVGAEAVVVELLRLCSVLSMEVEVEVALEVALGVLLVEVLVLVKLLSPSSLTESKEAWGEEEG